MKSNKLGYITKMTKKSHDGGIDIYAKKQTATSFENVIIQCLNYYSKK